MYNVNLRDLSHMADPLTDQRLLPLHLRTRSCPEQGPVYKKALQIAMEECLTKEQRELLHQRFWLEKSVAEIAAAKRITGSAASKRIAAAVRILKERIAFGIKLHNEISPQHGDGWE
ncbi:MAG: hypothetical protein LBU86_06855 [Oscillospiraceae bacterium]|jgi:DNA-directed RNA polymerase specialized sigma24 family protein|nr:hypothetical protein [Oscillospiraceae bacterium]